MRVRRETREFDDYLALARALILEEATGNQRELRRLAQRHGMTPSELLRVAGVTTRDEALAKNRALYTARKDNVHGRH